MLKYKKILPLLIIIFVLSAVPVHARNAAARLPADEPERLTVSEAVKFAVNRSTELKNLDENEYLNELTRDTLETTKRESITESQYINSLVSIMQNELRQAMFSENITLQKIMIEYAVTRYFAAVIATERDLFLYDKNLELSQKNLEIAKVRRELGLLSENSYDSLKLNFDKDSANREAKIIAIDNAYRALNSVMGKDLDVRWELVMDIEYEPLPEINLTRYVTDSTEANVAIKARENDLAVAEYKFLMSRDLGNASELEISATQAMRSLEDAKKNFEEKIISCHKEILNMEIRYAVNLKDYEDMQNQLAIKETQFELGRLTQIDIDTYKHQMLQFEYMMLGQINDHYIKKMQFENPDLL